MTEDKHKYIISLNNYVHLDEEHEGDNEFLLLSLPTACHFSMKFIINWKSTVCFIGNSVRSSIWYLI